MLDIANNALLEQLLNKATKQADEMVSKDKAKQLGRSQQAASCTAVANSMTQFAPQQVQQTQTPKPTMGQQGE